MDVTNEILHQDSARTELNNSMPELKEIIEMTVTLVHSLLSSSKICIQEEDDDYDEEEKDGPRVYELEDDGK